MGSAPEASSGRIRYHLRRPIPGRGEVLTRNARNTVKEIVPLYLDCDLLILDDLSGISAQLDRANEPIAAVKDSFYPVFGLHPQMLSYNEFDRGLDAYFNSGVMAISLHRWKRDNIQDSIEHFLSLHQTNPFSDSDQAILNLSLRDNWSELPLRFNVPIGLRALTHPNMITSCVGAQTINAALHNLAILHFLGPNKPWKLWYRRAPEFELWWTE